MSWQEGNRLDLGYTGDIQSRTEAVVAEETFKLPGSSYEELCNIIKGYSQVSDRVPLAEISKLVKIHDTTISRNTGFLVQMKVLEGGARKGPTPDGKQLGLALMHGEQEAAGSIWRSLLEESDFISKIMSAIRIRNGMSIANLQSHIAYTAGQKKTAFVMTGALTVINILKNAGMLVEQDGFVTAAPISRVDRADPGASTRESISAFSKAIAEYTIAKKPNADSVGVSRCRDVDISVVVNITIACTPSDLDGIGSKIAAAIDQIQSEYGSGSEAAEDDGAD